MKQILSIVTAMVLVSGTQAMAEEDMIGFNVGAVSIYNEDTIKMDYLTLGMSYQFNELNDFLVKPRFDLDYVNISGYGTVQNLYKGSMNGVIGFAEKNALSPYLVGGVGYEFVNGEVNNAFDAQVFLQAGGGLSYKYENGVRFNVEGKVLQIIDAKDQDNEVIVTAGIQVPLSKFKKRVENENECPVKIDAADEDRDGVTDMLDQCPSTPCYFTVDEYGCPVKGTLRIHFDTDKAKIRSYSMGKVEKFASFLIGNKGTTVKVVGHTDSVANDAYNMVLSQKRANTVVRKLVELGVSENRLSAVGKGETMPVATNSTALGKSLNRRIEVELTYPKK